VAIFAAPPAEIGVHATDGEPEHEIYLMLRTTSTQRWKSSPHEAFRPTVPLPDQSWGLVTTVILPGGERMGLYEPRHPSPLS